MPYYPNCLTDCLVTLGSTVDVVNCAYIFCSFTELALLNSIQSCASSYTSASFAPLKCCFCFITAFALKTVLDIQKCDLYIMPKIY